VGGVADLGEWNPGGALAPERIQTCYVQFFAPHNSSTPRTAWSVFPVHFLFTLNKLINGINNIINIMNVTICWQYAAHFMGSSGHGSINVIATLHSHTNTINPYIIKMSLFPFNIFFVIVIRIMLYPDNNNEKKKFVQSIPTIKFLYSFGI
jgi:hypothetical protein